MGGFFKFTKFKLITGHVILLAVAAATIWFIQRQARRLSEEDPGENDSRNRIFLISNALTRLNEAEALGIAIPRDAGHDHLASYARIIREVKRDMDTLRQQATSPRQKQQIDAVQSLLDRKIENMKALVKISLGPALADVYDRSLHALSRLKETTPSPLDIQVRREVSIDSVYIQPPKKGFWSFLKPKPSPILQVNTSERVVIDTLPPARSTLPIQNADTALHTIQSAWEEYREQKQLHDQELHRREIAALQDGQRLSGQIKRVLNELEKEEIQNTLARTDERTRISRELIRTITTVATVACIFAIIFVTIVVNDISRSQRYRKALEESNRYAQKLLHGREKLMLTVTHDIKSPLNSITGYVELLDNTPLAERQHYFLHNMKRSAEHILQLVNNLLDFSRLEAGKMEVDAIRYLPGQLLVEATESFLPQAERKGLTLTCSVDSSLDRERIGDPIKIRQIVINLLSNAIKYTREGNIRLSAGCTEDTPERMEISITDTGDGMTDEEQHLIFEEFTRLDAQHNDGAEGSGLGLTITRKLVELLGGTIRLTSAKGAGSTFTVRLPAGEVPPEPLPTHKRSPLVAPDIRILIIDDDPLQLEMISEFLRQKGITCETCDRATEALSKLAEDSFHLLLTDIQMPEWDGFKLLEQIRRSPREEIRALPVIAQSARGEMSEADYVKAGFSAYLNKPYSPHQLLACIARLTGSPAISAAELPTPFPRSGEFDLGSVRLFADNDEQAVREIIESFTRDCRDNFRLLEEHLNQADYLATCGLAHKMLPMFKQLAIASLIPDLTYLEQVDPSSPDPGKIEVAARHVIDKGQEIIEALSATCLSLEKVDSQKS
ncbi:MAG: response regulator [Odoribacteraceae bacterium]|jgi:signal transduction histidine kinase/CheY-like chemotaxis protein|nr:response regulator [Odoribacteraceae bacterium]